MIPWASEEDRLTAEQDLEVYGNAFITRGDDGKVRRIDPSRIQVQPEPKICPRCFQPYGRYYAHGPGFCIDRRGQ